MSNDLETNFDHQDREFILITHQLWNTYFWEIILHIYSSTLWKLGLSFYLCQKAYPHRTIVNNSVQARMQTSTQLFSAWNNYSIYWPFLNRNKWKSSGQSCSKAKVYPQHRLCSLFLTNKMFTFSRIGLLVPGLYSVCGCLICFSSVLLSFLFLTACNLLAHKCM